MFKGFFAKRRQNNMQKTENPWDMFYSYLDHLKNHTPEEYEGMHYELLTVSFFLISTEYADAVQQFNEGVASYYNLPKIKATIDCHQEASKTGRETCLRTLTYKDNTISWQYTPNPLDSEFEVFIMSQLVNEDIDIRLDSNSTTQSDRYWFALPHDIWRKLEDEFGKDFVRKYFEPMPSKFYKPNYGFKIVNSTL